MKMSNGALIQLATGRNSILNEYLIENNDTRTLKNGARADFNEESSFKPPVVSFFDNKEWNIHTNFAMSKTTVRGHRKETIKRHSDLLSDIRISWCFDPRLDPCFFPGYLPSISRNHTFTIIKLLFDSGFLQSENQVPDNVTTVYDLFSEVTIMIGSCCPFEVTSEQVKFLIESDPKHVEDPRARPDVYCQNDPMNNEVVFSLLLPTWFVKKSSALPIISLAYHDINIEVKTKWEKQMAFTFKRIFLDTKERASFARRTYKHLIPVHKKHNLQPDGTTIFINRATRYVYFKMDDVKDPEVTLMLNGDIFGVYNYHALTYDNYVESNMTPVKGFGLISFCLDGNSTVPSGSINFSRIDRTQIKGLKPEATIYQNHWDVGRIQGGMFGMTYV